MSLKRAFTKDGGSLTTIKNHGSRDSAWKIALLIRLVVFIPVVIAVIGLLLSHYTDITFEQYIEALKAVKEVFGV